jgi:predicted transcriptional regulator
VGVAKEFASGGAKTASLLVIRRTNMPRASATRPTEVELQILGILWELGPSPVRDIHRRLEAEKGTNYSTTVKMLSVMLEKGLVKRDERAQPHVYRAALSRKSAGQKLLGELIDRVYEGSTMSLVLQALSSTRATKEELVSVRQLLDQMEGR